MANYYVAAGASGNYLTSLTPGGSIATGIGLLAGPGDTLTIGAGTFTETAAAVLSASGTLANPILITGAGAGSTIWTRSGTGVDQENSVLSSLNRSHFHISGLTVQNVATKNYIRFQSSTGVVSNISVTNCSFINNGNRGLADGATGVSIGIDWPANGGTYDSIVFDNNTLTGCYGQIVRYRGVANSTMRNNVSTGAKSSEQVAGTFTWRGLCQIGQGSTNLTITGNTLSAMVKDAYVTGADKWQGTCIKFDTGGGQSNISNNTIFDINAADGSNVSAQAIHVESNCNDNIIKNNIVYNIGAQVIGIQVGSFSTQIAIGNTVDGNTLYNCQSGIEIANGSGTLVKNNIVHMAAKTGYAVAIHTPKSTSTTLLNNQYFDAGGNLNFYGDMGSTNSASPNKTYAQWLTSSGENGATTAYGDPLFVSVVTPDFQLQQGSPAIGTGVGGINKGAYPNQTFGNPIISNVGVSLINYTRFTVTWNTDTSATSQVNYGTTISYGSMASDAASGLTHSVLVSGLTATTLYHFQVVSGASTSGDFKAVTVLPIPPITVTP